MGYIYAPAIRERPNSCVIWVFGPDVKGMARFLRAVFHSSKRKTAIGEDETIPLHFSESRAREL